MNLKTFNKLMNVLILIGVICFLLSFSLALFSTENTPSFKETIKQAFSRNLATVEAQAADSVGVTIRHHRPNQGVVYHNVTVGGFMPGGQVYFHRDGKLMIISGCYTIEYNRIQEAP